MTDKFNDLGFAKLDVSRQKRTGMSETIFCQSKTKEQLVKIYQSFANEKISVLGTRCSKEQFEYVKQAGLPVEYDTTSQIMKMRFGSVHKLPGKVAVCTGGTSDLPIAEEAAQVAEFFGAEVERYFDVGISGIHRLLSKIEQIGAAQVIISISGMDGSLSSVIASQVKAPVISVPTSVGYGASFNGLTALLTMINSSAEGMSVVNIDNGFGAGVLAFRILRMIESYNLGKQK